MTAVGKSPSRHDGTATAGQLSRDARVPNEAVRCAQPASLDRYLLAFASVFKRHLWGSESVPPVARRGARLLRDFCQPGTKNCRCSGGVFEPRRVAGVEELQVTAREERGNFASASTGARVIPPVEDQNRDIE